MTPSPQYQLPNECTLLGPSLVSPFPVALPNNLTPTSTQPIRPPFFKFCVVTLLPCWYLFVGPSSLHEPPAWLPTRRISRFHQLLSLTPSAQRGPSGSTSIGLGNQRSDLSHSAWPFGFRPHRSSTLDHWPNTWFTHLWALYPDATWALF